MLLKVYKTGDASVLSYMFMWKSYSTMCKYVGRRQNMSKCCN